MFKVFTTLVNEGKIAGEGVLCEHFVSIKKAKEAGEKILAFPGSFYKIRKYDETKLVIIGGDSDNGEEVYSSKNEEKELKLLYLRINPKLHKFTDSMLFDSGADEIASSQWAYGDQILKIKLCVQGDVSVTYNGEVHHKPSEFPEELRKLIKEHTYDLDKLIGEENEVYFNNNNWFEYVWSCDYSGDGDVCENNISQMQGEDIMDSMLYYAKRYFHIADSVPGVYPKLSIYGYDKDNSVYTLYGMFEDMETAKEYANGCREFLDEDEMKRYCSDGTFEPIDWLEIISTDNYDVCYWNSYDSQASA